MPLGQELAELLHNIDQYNNSYTQLTKAMQENFNIPKETETNVLRSNLRNRGWTQEEIELYDKFFDYCGYLKRVIPPKIIHVLLFRYLLILHNFKINEIAKDILDKLS